MPTVPSPQAARFAAVLLAVRDRLVAELMLDDSRVRCVKGGGYALPFLAESHVRVRPLGRADFGEHGGGRRGLPVTRTVAVDCFVRSGIDDTGGDEVLLTEKDFGVFAFEEDVANALTYWTPRGDANQTPADVVGPLTVEPLKFVTPASDPDAPDPQRFTGYAVVTLYVECKYVARLLNPR